MKSFLSLVIIILLSVFIVPISWAKPVPGGLQGDYYDAANYSTPSWNNFRYSQIDSAINFSWGYGSPNSALLGNDTYSINWTGWIKIDAASTYYFGTYSDDSSAVYIDGQTVVSNGGNHSNRWRAGSIWLDEGFHKIVVTYHEYTGGANISLRWNYGSGYMVINSDHLYYDDGTEIDPYDILGDTIKIQNEYKMFMGQSENNKEFIVEVMNLGEARQSITIDIINSHTELFSLVPLVDLVTIEAGDVAYILLLINTDAIPAGVYGDLLLKVTTDEGETLYSNITLTVVESGINDLSDLSVSAEDIELSDYILGDTATLTAVVHNQGLAAASDVAVQFYEFGILLGEATLTEVTAQGRGAATITIPIGTSKGDHLIHVVVDPSDSVLEFDETNNEASKIVTWGTPSIIAGNIWVTGSSPSSVYAGDLFTVSGKAVYDVYVDGTRYTNYVVKGGSVQITIKDDAGNKWSYGGIHTDTNGNFNKYLQAPLTLDNYQLSMTVTDKTFSGTRELVFKAVEEPDTPKEPPAPPAITGTGYWTYTPSGTPSVSGAWAWTWTNPPVNEPVTQADLRVFSENIYFSNDNPGPEEDITIFAEINYWATGTNIIAEDVPVSLYATYPGSDKEKIGSTVISSLSAGSPDFGSQYIYGTWKNQGRGIYIIDVEVDPNFREENMLNNAATRAVIVGDLESGRGLIQGQVTNAWGGVEDVTVELYDEDGSILISSTLTSATGHYCFESLPIGHYQVHIFTPDGYETETDTRPAEVLDQGITVVDFYLTQVEEDLCGDLDRDGDVDNTDRNILRAAFGSVEGDDGFVAEADYDLDGNIDYSDYQLWYCCYKQYVAGL